MRGLVVAISGPSGAGKSTVAAELARRYDWTPLDEAYDRLHPRPSLGIGRPGAARTLELRLLDEEARRFGEARRWAGAGRTVVADTGFLDPVVYTAGLLILGGVTPETFRAVAGRAKELAREGHLGLADLTIRLVVPPVTCRARVARDPVGHPLRFRDRHERVAAAEQRRLSPALRAAAPGRTRSVAAGADPPRVAARIRAIAKRTRPLDAPEAMALRVLAAIEDAPAVRRALGARGNLKRATLSPAPPR